MKKNSFLAVMLGMMLAFGFVAVACADSGGNIIKVKNGVFKNVDASITVGRAIENNSTLKGGKWAELEKDGRDYVTYTVKFTPTQIEGFIGKNKQPNLTNAKKLNYYLQRWRGNGSSLTTMPAEVAGKACDIFSAILSKRDNEPKLKDFFHPFTDEWIHRDAVFKAEYFSQWFHANKGNITYEDDDTTVWPYREEDVIWAYNSILRHAYFLDDLDDAVQNGKLTGEALRAPLKTIF